MKSKYNPIFWGFFWADIRAVSNWIGAALVISQPVCLLSIRKTHWSPLSAACCLHCLRTRPRAAQSADCITAAVCGFWNGSISQLFPQRTFFFFFIQRCSVNIQLNLIQALFFIFRWDPLTGDQLLAKVNRSFLCLLSNRQGRRHLTHFHDAIRMPQVFFPPRLSLPQKHLLLLGGVATGQAGGHAGELCLFQSLNSTASVQIESNTSVSCTSFRCVPLSATASE